MLDPLGVGVEERRARPIAGVVDEQVDPRVALEHPCRDRLDGGAVGDVARLVLVARRAPARRERPTTCQPRARSARHSSAPMPDEAPVTTATRIGADTSERRLESRVFEGKRGLVLGVANKRSIAWAIAQRLAEGGAQLAFTFQGERIESNVRELAESVVEPARHGAATSAPTRTIARVFAEVGEAFGGQLDLLVHSVAFAAAEDLEGRFTDTPRDRFWMALDVSAYSLVACARAAEPLMEAAGGGSIVTMTYLGGERAVPHYNVMGVAKATLDSSVQYLAWDLGQKNIRVNAVSAGPVRTLAARSIAGFPTMEAIVEERAPLHRHVDADDVGAAAAYLLGDDARNVTGHDALRRHRLPRDGHVGIRQAVRFPAGPPSRTRSRAAQGTSIRVSFRIASAVKPTRTTAVPTSGGRRRRARCSTLASRPLSRRVDRARACSGGR